MKALFFDEPKKPVVSQVQSPSITPNEVLIRSRRVGICHSDYELLAGQYIIPISYPVIPGHEWVGEVVEVGKNVTGLSPAIASSASASSRRPSASITSASPWTAPTENISRRDLNGSTSCPMRSTMRKAR